jgi:hypothetical protein
MKTKKFDDREYRSVKSVDNDSQRFLKYSSIAFFAPLIVTAITLALDFSKAGIIQPEIGLR